MQSKLGTGTLKMGPNYLSLKDLMATDYPEQTWLAKELIPAGALTAISACCRVILTPPANHIVTSFG